MTDLTDFLLARIAEDEEVVRHCLDAIDADRTEYAQQVLRRTGPYSTVTSASHCGQDMGPRGTVEATPGRTLAECEAKRRVVEGLNETGWLGRHRLLAALALPYADHEDYDSEWTP